MKNILDNAESDFLKELLYKRGFLICETDYSNLDDYPFYGNWSKKKIGEYYFYINKFTNLYITQKENQTNFLIGHAIDPFSREGNENLILNQIIDSSFEGSFGKTVNKLTGIFICGVISKNDIICCLDASGMQTGYYYSNDNEVFFSSHVNLINDFKKMTEDSFVRKLIKYKYYKYMMGNYLPGDITKYLEAKRIMPNTVVSWINNNISIERIYPLKMISMCSSEAEYNAVINSSCDIMKSTMELVSKKYKNAFISLTGGVDSNTTFAAANGLYDKFSSFSYVSMDREKVDAEAAKRISDYFGVRHKTIIIPSLNQEIPNFDIIKQILEHNGGGIGTYRDNEIRKKAYLMYNPPCEVEIKSWISETIRAYAYKYFGRKKFKKHLKPRDYSALYKIFIFRRLLLQKTNNCFEQYIKKTKLKEHLFNYDETDFFVWEMMHGGKCGIDISNMRLCFEIFIPYNNRILLDNLLRVPLPKRIADQSHADMKKQMNKELYDLNIRVVNLNETKKRKVLLNLIYTINSILPF